MNSIIKEILIKIENNGYEAYLVGGFVRDYLLGIKSNDIDIATNMPVEQLMLVFPNSKVFENYNSVKFISGNYDVSITTYRKELKYKNNKPSKVILIDSLKEDSLRRDFTINSIYMDSHEKIIDPKNGINDINNRIIRVIGNAEERLKEDNTRILRAIRLMCTLNFKLDEELKEVINDNKELLSNINYNKKKYELDKIFKSENYMLFFEYFNEEELYKYFGITHENVKGCSNYLEVWSKLNALDKYNFTKEEKKIINKYLRV